MKVNFHETLEEAAMPLPSDRSTGFVLAAACAALGGLMWSRQPTIALAMGGLSTVLALASLAAPAALHPLNVAWMGLSRVLGCIFGSIAMAVIFAFTIVPLGLVMQLRADPLGKQRCATDDTYWIVPEVKFGPDDMTRQF